MCADRQKIAEAVAALTPQERAAVEDLVLEKVLREASEREQARDPEAHRAARAHAEAVVASMTIPPGAEEKIRAAWAEIARGILAEDVTP